MTVTALSTLPLEFLQIFALELLALGVLPEFTRILPLEHQLLGEHGQPRAAVAQTHEPVPLASVVASAGAVSAVAKGSTGRCSPDLPAAASRPGGRMPHKRGVCQGFCAARQRRYSKSSDRNAVEFFHLARERFRLVFEIAVPAPDEADLWIRLLQGRAWPWPRPFVRRRRLCGFGHLGAEQELLRLVHCSLRRLASVSQWLR